MTMTTKKIADLLREISMRYEHDGDMHRANNYNRAAKSVEGKGVMKTSDLKGIKGIGPSTRKDVSQILKTGTCARLERLRKNGPPATIAQFQRIPGVGPKTALKIWEEYEVATLEDLKKGIEDGTIPEEDMLDDVEFAMKSVVRRKINEVLPVVTPLLENIRDLDSVLSAEFAGSLRRKAPTIKDVDILIALDDNIEVEQHETLKDEILNLVGEEIEVDWEGDRKLHFNMDEIPIDILFVPESEYGAALQYFTGSKEHNIALRSKAKKEGLVLNEKGLWAEGVALTTLTEKSIYEALGVPYVVPELREESNIYQEQPKDLIDSIKDIKGTLHNHTDYSDGKSTMEEMIQDAEDRGWKYIAITDHSQALSIANGLSPEKWKKQRVVVNILKARYNVRILHGSEMDVLVDGDCDYDDEMIKEFDFVLLALHKYPRQDVAERFIKAIRHVRDDIGITKPIILAHPSGRQFSKGPIADTDWDELFKVCTKYNVALEINSMPERQDLDWTLVKRAKAAGCKFAINCDAHHTIHQEFLWLGINVARRGGLTKDDILNTQEAFLNESRTLPTEQLE